MEQARLTVNCDLGEGVPREELLFPLIDVASVACGGHFGNRQTLISTLRLAKKFGKRAGAHPSYPDPENFGRKSMTLTPAELNSSIESQLQLFAEEAKELGLEVDHIKFHGALYNDSAKNPILAEQLCKLIARSYPKIPLLVPPFSQLEKAALNQGLPIRREVFGDRRYQSNYQLTSRDQPGALLTELNQVEEQLQGILHHSQLQADTGGFLPIQADTLCFHGDNPGIHQFLPLLRKKYWPTQP